MSKIITNEIFQQEIEGLINPDLELLGEYIDSKTKIPCKCKKCEYEWTMLPGNIKKGKGCPICGRKKTQEHRSNNAKIKNVKKLLQVSQEKNYILLTDYIDSSTKIKCKCKICGYEWEAIPSNLLKGEGCYKCGRKSTSNKLRLSLEEVSKRLDKSIEIITYGNPSILRCNKCNYEWEIKKISSSKNIKCPHCSGKKILQTDFIEKINGILPEVDILGNYTTAITPIKCKCKICGTEFYKDPHHLYRGQGCPTCSKSSGEVIVENILNKYKIIYKDQFPIKITKEIKMSGNTYVDFYLPDYNTFIEYNGIQHYQPVETFGGVSAFEIQQKRDQFLKEYCKTNQIRLLEISYLEKQNDIESIILKFIGHD